jgi:hypothetical protein
LQGTRKQSPHSQEGVDKLADWKSIAVINVAISGGALLFTTPAAIKFARVLYDPVPFKKT